MYADEVEKERRPSGGERKSFGGRASGIDGKWKHDRFQSASSKPRQQNYTSASSRVAAGGNQIRKKNISISSIRAKTTTVIREKPQVPAGPSTLFISNLASSVSQEDLDELFQQYNPEVVTLHFDSNGTSLGTADLVVPAQQVAKIQKDLEGVLLDGQEIEILEANVAKQVSVFDRIKKVSRPSNFKAGTSVRVTVPARGGRFVRSGRF